jgi:hypothetical protein
MYLSILIKTIIIIIIKVQRLDILFRKGVLPEAEHFSLGKITPSMYANTNTSWYFCFSSQRLR